MSDALSYSVELAAERSSLRKSLEKRLQKSGLHYDLLEDQLKKLGLKGFPSNTLIDSLASLKHDARNTLDALIESGYKCQSRLYHPSDVSLSSAIYLLDTERDTPSKYLKVFRKLKEKFSYKTVNIVDVGEQLYQVDYIFKISRLKGDVCKIIDALAEVGYSLIGTRYRKFICYADVEVINDFTKINIDRFLRTFDKLKRLGYKSVAREYPMWQIKYILEISQLGGHASNAIDILAESGYKIENYGIARRDVEKINSISDQLWKKSLEELPICLYKNSPGELMRRFKNLSIEDKKVIIKSIFNCEKNSDLAIITWLDENYPELVREVGLSLV